MSVFKDEYLERVLLGTLIRQPECIPLVDPEIFYRVAHQKIFAQLCHTYNTQKLVSIPLVMSALPEIPASEIESLTDGVAKASEALVQGYIDRLASLRQKRQIYVLSQQVQASLKADDIDHLDELLEQMTREKSGRGKVTVEDVRSLIRGYEEIKARGGGVKLGFPTFDRLTNGMREGEIAYLMARPGVAKSAFAQNCLRNFVINYPQQAAVFFSFEMGTPLLGERLLGIDLDKPIRDLVVTDMDKERTCQRYKNIFYITVPTMTTHEIYSTLVKLKFQADIKFVAVDFLGRINTKIDHEYTGLRMATKALKDYAKELDVAFLVLSQVSREKFVSKDGRSMTDGGGWMPLTLQSGRGSGTIEEDSDFVMGVYRPELNKQLGPEALEMWRDVAVLQILKSRRTELPHDIYIHFNTKSLRMTELEGWTPSPPRTEGKQNA